MNCLACGNSVAHEKICLCQGCYDDICVGGDDAYRVIEVIEARMIGIIADLESQLTEQRMNCRCDEQGMIAKYEAQKIPVYEGSIPHHPFCECDHCIN